VFANVSIGSIALQVPVASLADYQSAQVWRDFGSIIGGATLKAAANNPTWGSVTGAANGWLPTGAAVNLIAAPAADFDFEKWTSGGADLGTNPALTLTLTQDTAVTAIFKPSGSVAVLTVTFNANGGSSVAPLPVVAGAVAVRPDDPTRSGYSFAGWYKEAALTTAWSFDADVVTASITLYARWTKVSCTVTFNSNSGSEVAPQTVATGSTAAQPTAPTRSAYVFAGWYRDAALTSVWTFASDVVNDDVTLYAKWISVNATRYTVTFSSRGGSSISAQQVEEGGKASQPTPPTLEGYTFAGWYKESTLTNAWSFANDVVNANITLYAKWISGDVTSYTVTFNSNGGSDVAPQTVATGGKASQPTAPTLSGHTFIGWYKEAALTTEWSFATDVVTADLTLYAKWNSATAVSGSDLIAAKVYPNPVTNGELRVESEALKAGDRIAIYNLSGALVGVYEASGALTVINVSHLAQGVYIVKAGRQTATVFVK
jgi:uncharacterized repeat protein (TIGR02543 family)